MSHLLFGVIMALSVTTGACCYEKCIQNFTTEMERISLSSNSSSELTAEFCRAMRSQIQCLKHAALICTLQQKTLIDNLLSFFIQPDYQRTCNGRNTTSAAGVATDIHVPPAAGGNFQGSFMTSSPWGSSYAGVVPTSGRILMICRQKFQVCQTSFNLTFPTSMPVFNISGLCQNLKQYTICFINLLSSECAHLVPRDLVYDMEKQHGDMCSHDAQANTQTVMGCANLTMKCYQQFNSSLPPSSGGYQLVRMCSAMGNYSKCMHKVGQSPGCYDMTRQGLAGLDQFVGRHNAFCGQDNGHTASLCVQSFQDCFSSFNSTFFPGLHAANLTIICSSLSTYDSCVTRLSATCSQQFGQMIQSVQTLRAQFATKCHPDIIKIASCAEVGECSQAFFNNYTTGVTSSAGLCESIGDYFPCIERGLNACHLPQSSTDVSFGGLGILMKGYCEKLSRSRNVAGCPAFFKCTAATWVSFSPSIMSLYEGSTWCTFLQLSIGCAEQAVQSSDCSLVKDEQLRKDIWELDQVRIQKCEADGRRQENMVEWGSQKTAESKGGAADSSGQNGNCGFLVAPPVVLTATVLSLLMVACRQQ